jgi:membrane associated rhomboid family serine protease
MDFFNQIKQRFLQGDALTRLIFINVLFFALIKLIQISLTLFNISSDALLNFISVPADLNKLLQYPWTVFTYMFVHNGVFHILFNMVVLFWFGKIFLMYFNQKQLVALYIIGGLGGAAFYFLAYNTLPYFIPQITKSLLLGASASIMAIIISAALKAPDMQLRMLFIGNVKLKYIALFVVLMSLYGVTSSNAGGEIAHLGGALMGYIFIVSLRSGKDITSWLNKILDFFTDLFKPKKFKVTSKSRQPKMTDAEYNVNKVQRMKDIDKILDKIKTSGYQSLTADEKNRLFDQGRNN